MNVSGNQTRMLVADPSQSFVLEMRQSKIQGSMQVVAAAVGAQNLQMVASAAVREILMKTLEHPSATFLEEPSKNFAAPTLPTESIWQAWPLDWPSYQTAAVELQSCHTEEDS